MKKAVGDKKLGVFVGDDAGLRILAETVLPASMAGLTYFERPVIWKDLQAFGERHLRTSADLVYDLALQSKYKYIESVRKPTVVPFDLELLMRLYDTSPSSAPWLLPNVSQVFELLYAPVIRQYSPDSGRWTEVEFKTAELACGRRYARSLGRADTATYRWIKGEGKVTRRLSNILAKIVQICQDEPSPLSRFEEIVKPLLRMRGVDLDKEVPLPTAGSVRRVTPGRRVSVKDATVAPKYAGGGFA
jgi:hypothetical protein